MCTARENDGGGGGGRWTGHADERGEVGFFSFWEKQ